MAIIAESLPTQSAAARNEVQQQIDAQRARTIRAAYTTRFAAAELQRNPQDFEIVRRANMVPRSGDVVIANVAELGKHTRLQSPVSRRQLMFVGQEIMVAYGHRYAPDQFLAHVPDNLGPCQLVAGGGVASEVIEQHASIDKATQLEPVGLLMRQGKVVNLLDFAPLSIENESPRAAQIDAPRPPVIAVLGTSMNSGKSTTLGCLVNGLVNSGMQVAAGKATGTGAGNDPNLFTDAGAFSVCDFTDFGFPTTYRLDYETVRDLLVAMIREQSATGAGTVVIEIADGLFQGETSRLLRDPIFTAQVDRVLFSAQDALGAQAGERILLDAGLDVAAVSGVLTASPLAAMEAQAQLATPVIGTFDLCQAEVAAALLPTR
ncbi:MULTISPECIES: hypothetical protein [Glutamicibacter]|uniref:DUF1611 domain-containing protein n=2 Tax=Glutamicibacter arilaitensis TaxID=256701 RepID=A0A2N7RZR8_9MICC|nr:MULTISPECIES: hypothetical protein [Glutamicibacter]PMQ19380.1 DUF1611 domain-containing protein [Glutamicibacter arilaitensis]CBT74719.1 conserved hypothetical protein [Glutamicibacter arilaitensis Re117]HCH48474.1 DUF1611 domain-containing protein [Glutamicibacter sp.]HCM94245.1 DUF1611 domain-containing protein [Glutamicibacter sp.]